jgi:hypothetical protein
VITLRKHGGKLGKPGSWRPVTMANGARGALVECPTCGRESNLRHPITAKGVVADWSCAFDDCDCRREIRLQAWDGGAQGWGGRAP